MLFRSQAEDGIRDLIVTGKSVLFRSRQPHLPHPLLRLPALPPLSRRLRQQPLKLSRPALPPNLQKIQIQQESLQQPPLLNNPNPQLRPLPNVGRLARQQILARPDPPRPEEQQWGAQPGLGRNSVTREGRVWGERWDWRAEDQEDFDW